MQRGRCNLPAFTMWLHPRCTSSGIETRTTRCSGSCSCGRRSTDVDSVASLEARDDLGALAVAEACLHPVQDALLPLEDPDLLATGIRRHPRSRSRAAGSGPHVRPVAHTSNRAAGRAAISSRPIHCRVRCSS